MSLMNALWMLLAGCLASASTKCDPNPVHGQALILLSSSEDADRWRDRPHVYVMYDEKGVPLNAQIEVGGDSAAFVYWEFP